MNGVLYYSVRKIEPIHQKKTLSTAKDNKQRKGWFHATRRDISFAMKIIILYVLCKCINHSCTMYGTNHTISWNTSVTEV
jgi:hypothetical protein